MIPRLIRLLPDNPPDWMIGFWTVYGIIFLFSLLALPSRGAEQVIFYWARLVAALICFAVAAALTWRRSHR